MQHKLYALRKEKNVTQEELADLIGKSIVTYRNKERSRVPFDSDEMFIISKFFGKKMEDIFLPTESPKR